METFLTLTFRAEDEELVAVRDEVRARLVERGMDASARNAVDLVLEELVGNTIRHGTRGARCALRVAQDDGSLRLELEDDAHAFDPTAHPEPARPSSLAEARIGGLGIAMVRRVARELHYERAEGWNRLALVIPLTARSARP